MIADLLSTALLGTERAKTLPDSELSYLYEDSSAEQALLSLAGALSLRSRVGAQPQRLKTQRDAPLLEPKAPCSAELAHHLSTALESTHADLLPDSLSALAEAGLRVPELLIPDLLDLGLKRLALRAVVVQVIGATGEWLATQNPDWYYASPEFNSWQGARQEFNHPVLSRRQGALYQLRLRDPDSARALVASAWKRTASPLWLLRALEPHLSTQDEAFLETALEHRNVTVRRKAADLLTRLPGSQLSQRMAHRMNEVLNYRPRLNRIDLHFPELEPALLRDGVLLRTWKDKTKVRRAQLVDMVSAVPISYWLEAWELSPSALVRAVANSDEADSLRTGLALASERQRCAELAFELLKRAGLEVTTQRLVPVLEAGQVLELATALTASLANSKDVPDKKTVDAFVRLLSRWTQPWSAELVGVFVAALPQLFKHHVPVTPTASILAAKIDELGSRLTQPGSTRPLRKPAVATHRVTTRNLLRQAARRIPPELALPTASAILLAAQDSDHLNHAQSAAEKLTFRADFYNALYSSSAFNSTTSGETL